ELHSAIGKGPCFLLVSGLQRSRTPLGTRSGKSVFRFRSPVRRQKCKQALGTSSSTTHSRDNDEPIQSSALRSLRRPRRWNRHDPGDAFARVAISDRDAAADSGRPPQCVHLAEAILLDYGPRWWLQPFETAWRRLLHPRTNSGRRDWRNGLRTRPPQSR